jgi:hypothetical protein
MATPTLQRPWPGAVIATHSQPDKYTVIMTGWRDAIQNTHGLVIIDALAPIRAEYGINVLLRHGRCKYGGADLIADTIGRAWGWEIDENPAEERNGQILGPARNDRMCAKGGDICLGFPGPGVNYRSGTWNCLMYAASYGIPCQVFPLFRPRLSPGFKYRGEPL